MRRSLNLNKKSNMHCAHCAHYSVETSIRDKLSNNVCTLNNSKKRYYQTCPHFIWSPKYLSINGEKDQYDSDGNILCRRCGKPLTDSISVARKFGETCYLKRLHSLKRRNKRLF